MLFGSRAARFRFASRPTGLTFGATVNVATGLVRRHQRRSRPRGSSPGPSTPSGFRSSEFPHAAVNPSNGNIYVTFDNHGAGADKGDSFSRNRLTPVRRGAHPSRSTTTSRHRPVAADNRRVYRRWTTRRLLLQPAEDTAADTSSSSTDASGRSRAER